MVELNFNLKYYSLPNERWTCDSSKTWSGDRPSGEIRGGDARGSGAGTRRRGPGAPFTTRPRREAIVNTSGWLTPPLRSRLTDRPMAVGEGRAGVMDMARGVCRECRALPWKKSPGRGRWGGGEGGRGGRGTTRGGPAGPAPLRRRGRQGTVTI